MRKVSSFFAVAFLVSFFSQVAFADSLSCPSSAKVKKQLVAAINNKISEDLKGAVSNLKVRTELKTLSVSKMSKDLSGDMFGVGISAAFVPASSTSDDTVSVSLSEISLSPDLCVYTASARIRATGITTDAAKKKVTLKASVSSFTFKSSLASSGKLTKG